MEPGSLLGGRPGVVWNRNRIGSPYSKSKVWTLEKQSLINFRMWISGSAPMRTFRFCPPTMTGSIWNIIWTAITGNHSCDVRKDTLFLEHTGDSRRIGVNFFYFGSMVSGQDIKTYVTLYIPEDADMGSLHVYNDSGDLSMESLTFGDTELEISYGNVKLRSMNFEDLEADLESGDFKAEELTAQDLFAENEYGDIVLEKASVQDADITQESGAMEADELTSVSLAIKSEYGSVTLDKLSAETAELELESGNLRLMP